MTKKQKNLQKPFVDIKDKYDLTIILVEHDMELVMDICDRICAMSFGQMLAIGSPSEIQSNKQVQTAYLGVSKMNALEIKDLVIDYGIVKAIKNVSMNVKKGPLLPY